MAAQGAQIPTPNTTSDTTFPGYLLEAAQILSAHLRQLGIDHSIGLALSGSSGARSPSCSGFQLHRSPGPSILPRHMLRTSMPRVLQRLLSQPLKQTRCWRCPRPWNVERPCPPLPHSCVSTSEGSTSLASVPVFTTTLASPRGSGDTGALADADHTPPPSSRFAPGTCKSTLSVQLGRVFSRFDESTTWPGGDTGAALGNRGSTHAVAYQCQRTGCETTHQFHFLD